MEAEILKSSGLTAGMVFFILAAYKIIKSMEGKQIRSKCCGRKMDIGFSIEEINTTPVVTVVENPMPPPHIEIPVLTPKKHEQGNKKHNKKHLESLDDIV